MENGRVRGGLLTLYSFLSRGRGEGGARLFWFLVTEWLEAEPGRFRPVIRKRSFSERLFGKRAGGGEVVDAPYLSMCEASE